MNKNSKVNFVKNFAGNLDSVFIKMSDKGYSSQLEALQLKVDEFKQADAAFKASFGNLGYMCEFMDARNKVAEELADGMTLFAMLVQSQLGQKILPPFNRDSINQVVGLCRLLVKCDDYVTLMA